MSQSLKRQRIQSKEWKPKKTTFKLSGNTCSVVVDRDALTRVRPKEGDREVGDLLWANAPWPMCGHPWWPCMVSVDPLQDIYTQMSGNTGRIYHVQYFGGPIRGWASVGQIMDFEGRDKYMELLESEKSSSPKGQEYAVKPGLRKRWRQSVNEAERAAQMDRPERVRELTFEYSLYSSKVNPIRKSENSMSDNTNRDSTNECEIGGKPLTQDMSTQTDISGLIVMEDIYHDY